MYCIQCGVELSAGQASCPLCGTRVYHPDLPKVQERPTYPKTSFPSEALNRRGLLFIITVLWLLPLMLPLIFELHLRSSVTWSGYAAGGVLLAYICLILPSWFYRAEPVIFLSADVAAVLLYLLYLDLQMQGGWFLPFALPLTLSFGGLTVAVVALHRFLHRGYLYIYGGGVIALGAWTILLEFLIHLTFSIQTPVFWSLFSCTSLLLLGLLLIAIEVIKPVKESLYRMFFIGKI